MSRHPSPPLAGVVAAAALAASAAAAAPVMLNDFEAGSPAPKVWVVHIPGENATAELSSDAAHDGKGALKLDYRFTGGGPFQYLGIPNPVSVGGPLHQVRFWIRGDGSLCSYGIQVTDSGGETHQYGKNSGQGGVIDFDGWKEAVFDLDAPHETWGGDKNGKLDPPLTAVTFTIGQPAAGGKTQAAHGRLFFDALAADAAKRADEPARRVSVAAPEYGAEVQGDVTVVVSAPGFDDITAQCWKQGAGFGSDSTVASVRLNADGGGSFRFPADGYPHGPLTVRITGKGRGVEDRCHLQLYNRGGGVWREGIPKDPPRAAAGMSLVFADDFDGPLSISSVNPKARYYDHKPPDGVQDFSEHTFAGCESPRNPFRQIGSYLRIRASDRTHSAGILSSLRNDGTGVTARAPCYFECRFLGPNAVGTWPAFWLMTDYMNGPVRGTQAPCDELDVIEAYGGEGPGAPNAYDSYMITPHCWGQGETGKALEKAAFDGLRNPVRMRPAGIPSAWYETFHTYGCKITGAETVYYCDDIEVGRHPTFPLSREKPFFFLINLATGGGWPVDLSRYHGVADMYVDFVRVYQK